MLSGMKRFSVRPGGGGARFGSAGNTRAILPDRCAAPGSVLTTGARFGGGGRVRPGAGSSRFSAAVCVIAAIFLSACASVPPGENVDAGVLRKSAGKQQSGAHSPGEIAAARQRVVDSAKVLLGQKPDASVQVAGRQFTLDCIGTVSAAWWGAGYDIQRDFAKYSGNGVLRLYASMKDWGVLHEMRDPKPGDVVFWENTWDRNDNGVLYDDGLTHAGIVIEVESDGTVHYLHSSYSRGVVIAYFNLKHPAEPFGPGGKVWNSPMYLGANYNKTNNPPRWLSGDLWSAFGDAGKTAEQLR